MDYTLDQIAISIENESNGLRIITAIENWYVPHQTIEEAWPILEKNYGIVKEHFQRKWGDIVASADLESVCFKVVLHYFQLYNHWRTMYPREANRDLTFLQKDFNHSNTSALIVDFFKKRYPENYADKCQLILGMTPEQFQEYSIRKEQFDNR